MATREELIHEMRLEIIRLCSTVGSVEAVKDERLRMEIINLPLMTPEDFYKWLTELEEKIPPEGPILKDAVVWQECSNCTRMWPPEIECPACRAGLPFPGARDTYGESREE